MVWLFVGALLLFSCLLSLQALLWVTPARLAQIIRYVGAGVFSLLALMALVKGLGALGIALVGAACMLLGISKPWDLRRLLAQLGLGQGFTDRISRIETRTLRVTIDQMTGTMDGQVLRGSFTGRQLSQMNNTDLLRLLESCLRVDRDAAALVEAFLQRHRKGTYQERGGQEKKHGFRQAGADRDWSNNRKSGGAQTSGPMTQEEALAVLGLEAGASVQEINRAYKSLMRKMHPDHGGSNYLASKINQAKDCLLGK